MSASLVGSEMCIRDRPLQMRVPWQTSAGQAAAPREGSQCKARRPKGRCLLRCLGAGCVAP
eukprot:8928310-Alexandrium_andersonii.AAC.1